LMFKGSGFYLTDYGKNAHRGESKPAAGGDSGAKADAPKADAGKAESSKPKAESSKTESPKPKAESPTPKSSKPKSE
jgi:predicted nucleic acid-binding Zn ribbon protein